MSTRLQNRTALVTGSTSGIGRAIAGALAAEGAHVVVSGRDPQRGAAAVAAIRASGGRADFVAADLGAGPVAVRALATDATTALGGRIDVLVNNAGVYPSGPTVELSDADLDAILDVNVRAPHVLTAAVVPGMIDQGAGVIVNVGSWGASVGLGRGAAYTASKAAIEQLTRAWAAEFGHSGIRVNAVSPGITATDGTADAGEFLAQWAAGFPAGRLATPEDIASGVVFLASEESSYVHGTVLLVDGGALGTR
jgi:NAD(P)-dependent dehydrogenase (short-subunit alcohol dehydrogenase family)